jgi:hypothetical protein
VEAVVAYFSTLSLETLEYKIFKQYSQQCAWGSNCTGNVCANEGTFTFQVTCFKAFLVLA